MAKLERFEVDPSKAASHFRKLPIVVRDILRLCDGRRTLEAICASSPIAGGETVEVLRRLGELGVVSVRNRPRVRRAASTPRLNAWLDGTLPPARPARARSPRPAAFAPPPAITVSATVTPVVVTTVEHIESAADRVEMARDRVSAAGERVEHAGDRVEAQAPPEPLLTAVLPAEVSLPVPIPAPPAVAAAAQVLTIDLTSTDFSAEEEQFFASPIDHLIED